MGNVNEDDWIIKCPRCGASDQNTQVPITMGTPPQCAECRVNPWKQGHGLDVLLHFKCMTCGQTYLIPKIEGDDREYQLFK